MTLITTHQDGEEQEAMYYLSTPSAISVISQALLLRPEHVTIRSQGDGSLN